MDKFGAKLILHLIYENSRSASIVGHRNHGYATVSVSEKAWFASKEAFMALVLKGFEQFFEEMKNGRVAGEGEKVSQDDLSGNKDGRKSERSN